MTWGRSNFGFGSPHRWEELCTKAWLTKASQSCFHPEKELSKQREEQVQRSWGSIGFCLLKEQKKGECGWNLEITRTVEKDGSQRSREGPDQARPSEPQSSVDFQSEIRSQWRVLHWSRRRGRHMIWFTFSDFSGCCMDRRGGQGCQRKQETGWKLLLMA